MTDPGICYCGAYGGGRHTRSARCQELADIPIVTPRDHGTEYRERNAKYLCAVSTCNLPRAPGFEVCWDHAHGKMPRPESVATYTKAELIMRAKLEHPKNPHLAVVLQNWIEENL